MRPSRSTSASSPRRAPPSSSAISVRKISASASEAASICTARPPSKRTVSPSMIRPWVKSGFVARTIPSTRWGSGETLGDTFERSAPFVPGGLGIRLVEAADVLDLLPQLLERSVGVEVGVDELGPFRRGAGRDAPVDGALVDHRRPLLDTGKDVAAEPFRVEIVEEVRLDRAGQRDRRSALVAELQRPLAVPGGDEVEHVFRGVLDSCALEMRVPVVDVDELRAPAVSARGECARELLLPQACTDVEDLSRLDVGAEVDD